jgi:hypothetical protein
MKQALLQSPDGSESAPRWFGAICLGVAVGIAVLNQFHPVTDAVEIIKAFLYSAALTLGGAKVAEAIKK